MRKLFDCGLLRLQLSVDLDESNEFFSYAISDGESYSSCARLIVLLVTYEMEVYLPIAS